MITVRQLLQAKSHSETWSIRPDASVFDALKKMAEANVGAIMVTNDEGSMVGIFTERDYARKIVLQGKTSLDTPLKEIMTRETVTIHPDQTLDECMQLMTQWHIRHLPVMEDGRLIGMISMRDVVETIINLKEETIHSLENYILSEGYAK